MGEIAHVKLLKLGLVMTKGTEGGIVCIQEFNDKTVLKPF
jgi:hypothetical protein